jgi:hypothetical protein
MLTFGRHDTRGARRGLATLFTLGTLVLASGGHALARQDVVRGVKAADVTRVIVELRVPGTGDERAIADAQRDVLARLGGTRVTVVRQYKTVPMIALEVDSAALAKLTQMGDLVTRVIPDSVSRTQEAR